MKILEVGISMITYILRGDNHLSKIKETDFAQKLSEYLKPQGEKLEDYWYPIAQIKLIEKFYVVAFWYT